MACVSKRDEPNPVAAAIAVAIWFWIMARSAHGEPSQPQIFIIHGAPKTCSAITQLDSALTSDYQAFFSGWTDKDYADAVTWADACAAYGWHIPGRPRLALLSAQHDRALGAQQSRIPPQAPTPPPVVRSDAAPPRMVWSSLHELPADGSAAIGFNATIISRYADTLPDIARRYGLGYEEISRANPGIDIWLPGEGTRIVLPGRHRLPSGSREGVVVNVAEHRLYYFPKSKSDEKPVVITYPVSLGMVGKITPLGQTTIIAKVEHPSWYPPASVRKEHAARGEPLPAVVAPGPDNPLGDYMLRLGFGDGSYEIHGTNRPVSVGMDSTYGCIGMYPEDVAALFARVAVGTPVRLVNEPL